MRDLGMGLLGLVLLVLFAALGGLGAFLPADHPVDGPCAGFLERPREGWVMLSGCRLEVDALVLANADGLETFADRLQGVSRRPYHEPPQWTALYVPVSTGLLGDRRASRLATKVLDRDVLAWVNALERADPTERERLLQQRGLLVRIAKPSKLVGRVSASPEADAVQTMLGTGATAGLMLLEPGPITEAEMPLSALLCGLAGLVLLGVTTRRLLRRQSAHHGEPQEATLDVSDVQLQLGELQRLRDESQERSDADP